MKIRVAEMIVDELVGKVRHCKGDTRAMLAARVIAVIVQWECPK